MFQGKTLDEYKFPEMQRLQVPGGRNEEARVATAGVGSRQAGMRAIEMALIEDKRATPELRKNLNTAGGPGVVSSTKKRIKKKFDFTPIQTEEAPSIGILEDESRVNQELGLDNFIQPGVEYAGL